MASSRPPRFEHRNGKAYDLGLEIDHKQLQIYIDRQEKAKRHNESQGDFGKTMNRMMIDPELNQAYEVHKKIKPKK